MMKHSLSRILLVVAFLSAPVCFADAEAEAEAALEAALARAHVAFTEGRWSDCLALYDQALGASPERADRLSPVAHAEIHICRAQGRWARAQRGDADGGLLVAAVKQARAAADRLPGTDPATAGELRGVIERLAGEIAAASAAVLERDVAEARAALVEGRWRECREGLRRGDELLARIRLARTGLEARLGDELRVLQLVSKAEERLSRALAAQERGYLAAAVPSLLQAQDCLGALPLSPELAETVRSLQDRVAAATAAVRQGCAAELEEHLAGSRAAYEEGRWDDCERDLTAAWVALERRMRLDRRAESEPSAERREILARNLMLVLEGFLEHAAQDPQWFTREEQEVAANWLARLAAVDAPAASALRMRIDQATRKFQEARNAELIEAAMAAWEGHKRQPGGAQRLEQRVEVDPLGAAMEAVTWLDHPQTRQALEVGAARPDFQDTVREVRQLRDRAAERWFAALEERFERWTKSPGNYWSSDGAAIKRSLARLAGVRGQAEVVARLRHLEALAREAQRAARLEEVASRRRPVKVSWALFLVALVTGVVLAAVEREPEGPYQAPTITLRSAALRVFVALCLALAVMVVLGFLYGVLFLASAKRETLADHAPALLALSAVACLTGALVLYRARWVPAGPPRAGVATSLLWLCAGAVLTIGGQAVISMLQEMGGSPVREQELLVAAFRGPTLALCLVVVFVVPGAEELLFRRAIYGNLRAALGPGAAMACSAVLFSAFHLNPSGFLVYGAIGAGLALVYERTGRLSVPIAIHALNNLLSATGQVWAE